MNYKTIKLNGSHLKASDILLTYYVILYSQFFYFWLSFHLISYLNAPFIFFVLLSFNASQFLFIKWLPFFFKHLQLSI